MKGQSVNESILNSLFLLLGKLGRTLSHFSFFQQSSPDLIPFQSVAGMGRRKLEMKRIEDKSSRQVTFSKRRSGLFKKAGELSVLCDVQVAVLIFSTRGRFYEFSSSTSLVEILDRYHGHCAEESAASNGATVELLSGAYALVTMLILMELVPLVAEALHDYQT